jgi:cytochrome b pre-mRNA-processing protein 3
MAAQFACQSCQARISTKLIQRNGGQQNSMRASLVRTAPRRTMAAAPKPQPRPARLQSRQFHHAPPRLGVVQQVVDTISPRASQTYMLYAATKEIYNVCARQATYQIDPKLRKDNKLEHTSEGEELGTGETMWHTGMAHQQIFSSSSNCSVSIDFAPFTLQNSTSSQHSVHGRKSQCCTCTSSSCESAASTSQTSSCGRAS